MSKSQLLVISAIVALGLSSVAAVVAILILAVGNGDGERTAERGPNVTATPSPGVVPGAGGDAEGEVPASDEPADGERPDAKPSTSTKPATATKASGGRTITLEGGTGARRLTLRMPRSIREWRRYVVTADGATGQAPSDETGGGFIVASFLVPGSAKACPGQKAAQEGLGYGNEDLGSLNVFVAGAFRNVSQFSVTQAGAYRVCGYLSRGDAASTYELLIDHPISVAPGDTGGEYQERIGPAGTYTAKAADIVGGRPNSSIVVTLRGSGDDQEVVRAVVKGVPMTTCRDLYGTDRSALGTAVDIDLNRREEGLENPVIGDSFSAHFKTDTEYGAADLQGGADGDGLIRGVVSVPSADGGCQGSFAFTARRDG